MQLKTYNKYGNDKTADEKFLLARTSREFWYGWVKDS